MKKMTAAAAAAVLLGTALLSRPEIRVKRFVSRYQDELEEAYQTGIVPAGIGHQYYNLWDGAHPMMEFILTTWGSNRYYGCYYSPDGVPLPFQNVTEGVELVQTGQAEWSWQGEGDNCGVTWEITNGWYYFEAEF